MTENISTTINEGVGTIVLDRPEVLNALNPQMAAGLKTATGARSTQRPTRHLKSSGSSKSASILPVRAQTSCTRLKSTT